MSYLKIYTQSDIESYISKRKGEKKFGEKAQFILNSQNLDEELTNTKAKFVLFGIKESVGVKANNGIQGTETAWESCLSTLLNTQSNRYNKAKKVLILGCLEFDELMNISKELDTSCHQDLKRLRELVNLIDNEVTNITYKIVKAGKIPIIIGGGHNNAYGNIKGSSLALNRPINAINFDAHTDFRALEGRHSGNGFSYAFQEGFLNNYFVFGLHENYTSKAILREMDSLSDNINYNTFESICIRKETSFSKELEYAKDYIKTDRYGIEIDLDAIENVASSAMTPSGFSVNDSRHFLHFMANSKKAVYLHLCEAAPSLSNENDKQTGKILSYLITDFIRVR